MRIVTLTLSLCAAAVLSACASMGPATQRVQPISADKLQADPALTFQDSVQWPTERWWVALGDEQLTQLIDEALAAAPTLTVAQARIAQAQAVAGLVKADGAPQVGLDAEAYSEHFPDNFIYPPPLGGSTYGTGVLQLQANWDLDFFGKHQAELDAALSTVRAATYQRHAVALSLAAGITRGYVQLAHEYELQDVLEATIKQRQAMLDVDRTRAKAGLDAASDSKVANASLAMIRQERAAVDERIAQLQDQLAALAGAGPGRGRALKRPMLRDMASTAVPASLPAELVARRADIAAQRARLEASLRHIDAAKTLFYPDINLAGFVGFQSIGLDKLLKWDSHMTGIGPALHLPIFDGGALRSNLRVTEAEFDAAAAQYNGLVIDAMREVADAAASERAIARQQAEQQVAEAEVKRAESLAQLRYSHGLSNALAVLTAQDRVLSQDRQHIELQTRQRLAWVELNRALGGGFQTDNKQAGR